MFDHLAGKEVAVVFRDQGKVKSEVGVLSFLDKSSVMVNGHKIPLSNIHKMREFGSDDWLQQRHKTASGECEMDTNKIAVELKKIAASLHYYNVNIYMEPSASFPQVSIYRMGLNIKNAGNKIVLNKGLEVPPDGVNTGLVYFLYQQKRSSPVRTISWEFTNKEDAETFKDEILKNKDVITGMKFLGMKVDLD